ncbi:MAG: tetratricopeptide repeat protein [Blastocatellia bacterium]
MENEVGYGVPVTAKDLARAFYGNWPRLIFLSGSKTAQAPDNEGLLPSFCESLVSAGAPAVLGWALPVGDLAATEAAAELYEHLAAGKRIDEAVARARQRLAESHSSEWHLLRMYADATPATEIVTPSGTRGREKIRIREARGEFLDEGNKSEVCPRGEFVGRRRVIQRSLRVLKSREGQADYAEGVLLHGMGGLGKSSLAARLCDRLPHHRRVFFFGAVDEREFLHKLGDKLASEEANRILNQSLTLERRLQLLLESGVMAEPALFVFDSFEHNLEVDDVGGYKLTSEAIRILPSLLTAIHRTASDSRVIVTCRYRFPLPGPARLHAETPGTMHDAELGKKLRQLDEKYPIVRSQKEFRRRAVALGAGNPRLLEWLYRVIADQATDQEAILTAIEAKTEEFREDMLLRELLSRQTPECRRLIALASVYEMPAGRDAIAAAAGDLPLDPHLDRAASLGLIEAARFTAASGETSPRFFVSPILAPLTAGEITQAERVEACGRAAKHLHRVLWGEAESRQTDDLIEIHRLALLASDNEIAVEVGNFLAWRLNNNSQFREAELLCRATLALGPDYHIFHALARAEYVLGKAAEASEHYALAFAQCPEEDRPNRGAIAHNWADLIAQQGDVGRALDLWQQSLAIQEQIGDVKGKAATLSMMAGVIAQQGDVKRALDLWQQSLTIQEQIGDVQGKAATLSMMAGVIAQQGDVKRALDLWQQSLTIQEQIGDVQGKAATLHQMAGVIAQQGDVQRALGRLDGARGLERSRPLPARAGIASDGDGGWRAVAVRPAGGLT